MAMPGVFVVKKPNPGKFEITDPYRIKWCLDNMTPRMLEMKKMLSSTQETGYFVIHDLDSFDEMTFLEFFTWGQGIVERLDDENLSYPKESKLLGTYK
jgi:hypothetical protein